MEAAPPAALPRYRVERDLDLCRSHGVCMGEAPEVFEVGETSKVALRREQIPAALLGKVELARDGSSTAALWRDASTTPGSKDCTSSCAGWPIRSRSSR
jgi:ferredoxin